MHAVLITFRSAAQLEELTDGYTAFAEALRSGASPGFVSKTWLMDGSTFGGFYGFEDRAAADRYLDEMFAPAVMNDPNCSDVRIERFDIIESFSAITNGLHTASAATVV